MIETVESITSMYAERDISMKLNMATQIINHINKLGYSSVDIILLKKQFIKNNYINYIKNIDDGNIINYDIWYNDFVKTSTYSDYIKMLDTKVERSILLSKYIGSNNTAPFYQACTIDELNYLGY